VNSETSFELAKPTESETHSSKAFQSRSFESQENFSRESNVAFTRNLKRLFASDGRPLKGTLSTTLNDGQFMCTVGV
jgi:hypothetical protein